MRNLYLTFLVCLLALGLNAQYQINGCVTDEDGENLIGASVLVKGTTTGVVTDIDGCFTIEVPEGFNELLISYTGYNPQEIKVKKGDKALQVKMTGATLLEEVVVVGYAPQRKESRSNAISTVSADQVRGPKNKRKKSRRKTQAGVSAPPNVMIRGYASTSAPPKQDPISAGEQYNAIQENSFIATQEEVVSTFGVDVDAASYSNIRRFLKRGALPPADAVRVEEMINYFDYNYPNPSDETPFLVKTELAPCPWQPEHQLLHIGLQGQRMNMSELPANNFVFLLDVSGSMNSHNKLPLLKESLKLMVNNLRESDKVSIVVYAGAAGLVLSPTPGNDKQKILDALDELRAGGSTAGGAGIKLAYKTAKEQFIKDGNNRVILATDGDFNVGVSDQGGLVKLIEEERKSGVFLSVLGFGMGNYQDGKMQQLADSGNGNHAYIDDLDEARKVLVTEFGGTTFTIAKDVKLQLHFNPALVQGYRLIGYENRMLNEEDFDDDTKDAGDMGAGHSVTALYEIIPVGTDTDLLQAKPEIDSPTGPKVSTPYSGPTSDICQLSLRYKKPNANKSKAVDYTVANKIGDLGQSSLNFRWSAAVAEFGMLLRQSPYKGGATYEHCQAFAEKAKGRDKYGYRKQMIEMIARAKNLHSTTAGK